MLFPNKLFTYSESIISKFPLALQLLQESPMAVVDLYKALNKQLSGVSEFMDLMDCLFALNKIEFDEEEEVLHYVEGNCM